MALESVKNLEFNTLNMYIEFEMIVDTDFGLLRFIAENFADERMFYIDTLNEDDNLIKGMLYERESYNPLVVPAIDESNMEKLNSLYDQFMDRYRKEILLDSVPTDICTLANNLIISDSNTFVSILCKDEMEEKIVNALLPEHRKDKDWDIIFYDPEDSNGIDIELCDALCIKYSKNLFRYNNIEGKTLYIADLLCNFDIAMWDNDRTKFPNLDSIIYIENNDVKFIEMYSYDPSYSVNGTFDYEESDEEEIVYNDDGSIHYDFEEESGVSHNDVELLKEWLTPEELAHVISTQKVEKNGPVTDVLSLPGFDNE